MQNKPCCDRRIFPLTPLGSEYPAQPSELPCPLLPLLVKHSPDSVLGQKTSAIAYTVVAYGQWHYITATVFSNHFREHTALTEDTISQNSALPFAIMQAPW